MVIGLVLELVLFAWIFSRHRNSVAIRRTESAHVGWKNSTYMTEVLNSSDRNAAGLKVAFLTLFTSMSTAPSRRLVNSNTLNNWSRLFGLNVTAVLFTNDTALRAQARQLGWWLLPLFDVLPGGAPSLPSMFAQAKTVTTSDLYGFVNGDILFDDSLPKTLLAVTASPALPKSQPSKNMLITGRRTNVANVGGTEAISWKLLKDQATVRGRLSTTASEDYFITNSGYPWGSYPQLAVGRRVYDNWLVLRGNQLNHIVIDGTETIPAVHQDTQQDGFIRKSRDNAHYNSQLLEKLFGGINYMAGQTICSPYETRFNDTGAIYVFKKAGRLASCFRYRI